MSTRLAGQLAPFEWSKTTAFLGFHSDLWLNLEGREARGVVPQAEAPTVIEELRSELLEIVDPRTGSRVFADAHRRDDVYSGPHAGLAPDLILDSWSAGYRVAPGREASEQVVVPPVALAGVNEAWSSDHRPLGIFVAGGPRVAPGTADELSLYDICPTALALLEATVPAGLDGRAAEDALTPSFLAAHPVSAGDAASRPRRSRGGDYSEDEAEAVAAHLKDLGYIE